MWNVVEKEIHLEAPSLLLDQVYVDCTQRDADTSKNTFVLTNHHQYSDE